MKKILGLDLGLESVGWALLEMEDSQTGGGKGRILDAGARVFPPAEVQKTWESPGKSRREKRGARRRLRRVRGRMRAIRLLFVEYGLLGQEYIVPDRRKRLEIQPNSESGKIYKFIHGQIDNAQISAFHREQNKAQGYDLWKLRLCGLERKLEKGEWAAVLTQLAKRRGFKSNRKSESKDDESGIMKKAVENNSKLLEKYATVGEMLIKDPQFNGRKRNKSAKSQSENYTHSILRKDLLAEINVLFEKQREFNNEFAGKEFQKEYLKKWEEQLSVSRGDMVYKMVGNCTFEKGEKRAPRMSYTEERFRALCDINHKIRDQIVRGDTPPYEITPDDVKNLMTHAATGKPVKFMDVRKILRINGYRFKSIWYRDEFRQFQTKVRHIALIEKNAKPRALTPEQCESVKNHMLDKLKRGSDELKIMLSDIRLAAKLGDNISVKGVSTGAFYSFDNYEKIRKAMSIDEWRNIFGDENGLDKIGKLAEICMLYSAGDERASVMTEIAGADVAQKLRKITLPCKDENPVAISGMQGYSKIHDVALKNGVWDNIKENPDNCMDVFAEAVTYYKNEKDINNYLDKHPCLSSKLADIGKCLVHDHEIDFKETANLSLKAMRNIMPFLEAGMKYNAACEKAGYNHSMPNASIEKSEKLPPVSEVLDIRNPRVLRTMSQARKIVNAVTEKHGKIDGINIELLRDLARSPKERRDIQREQENYRTERDVAETLIREIAPDLAPTGNDILKARLWLEQGGFCPYSGKHMDQSRLFDGTSFEIDHILPLSRSMDDSQNNKVLCLVSENRQKGNHTPYEYFAKKNNLDKWEEFKQRVKLYRIGRRTRLLKERFSDEDELEHRKKWVDSPESKWIAREFSNYVENYLEFSDSDSKNQVQTRKGTLTAFLRAKWGLAKDRSKHNRHHALDAIVIAASTQSMVQRVSKWSSRRETMWARNEEKRAHITDDEGEIIETTKFDSKTVKKIKAPMPWENFREDALDAQERVFVSRPARRKLSGEAHNETLIKQKHSSENSVSVRNSDGRKHGIPGSKQQKESWPILRTDVFCKTVTVKGKDIKEYYLSVVRPYHRTQGTLPKELVPTKDLASLTLEHKFCFSLYPGDAVLMRKKITPKFHWFPKNDPVSKTPMQHAGIWWEDGVIGIIGYYQTTDVSSGGITIQAHDNSWHDPHSEKNPEKPGTQNASFRTTVRQLIDLRKLEIPLLGNISMDDIIEEKYIVKGEERRELAKPAGKKSRRPKP